MRRSGMILIVLGLVLALLSAVGVFSLLKQQEPTPVVTPAPTVKVVVTTQNIPERTVIQANMVTVKDWPPEYVPVGAMNKTQDVIGKVTSSSMVVGEVVLAAKITGEEQAVGLAPTLPPGLVAVVLALSPVSAVGGAVREGDNVDVLISLDYMLYDENGDESKNQYTTFYTIQDTPVLKVGGTGLDTGTTTQAAAIAPTSTAARTTSAGAVMVTVLVTPQDALLLKYARERGTIDLALRSPQFHDQVSTDPVYLEYIIRRFDLPRPLIIHKDQTGTGEQK